MPPRIVSIRPSDVRANASCFAGGRLVFIDVAHMGSGVMRARLPASLLAQMSHRLHHGVVASYVSIDLDSADLWVLRALLFSEFRPRVVGVEYNSNYPPGYTIAFPNPPWEPPSHERSARWGGGCYFGSGAAAIELVAREAG